MRIIREKEMKMPIFADRFHKLRDSLGSQGKPMSQDDFAKYIGISRVSVGFYENGERVPDAAVLKQICEKCKCSSDWLLGVTDAKTIDVNVQAICNCTGLSENSISTLKDCWNADRHNSITLTVNSLLKNKYVLGEISHFLYYNLSTRKLGEISRSSGEVVLPYITEYKYRSSDSCVLREFHPKEVISPDLDGEMTECITNRTYKKTQILNIIEELEKLLKQENSIEHFSGDE